MEAVVNTKNATRINLPNHEENRRSDVLEMVRTALSIIGELCKKSINIRNFAVINHKTYTYCLKAYKKYNRQV